MIIFAYLSEDTAMLQASQTKVLFVADCLSGGGAERVVANLSHYFASKDIEVHIAVIEDRVTYSYAGKLLNLGLLKKKHKGIVRKLKGFTILRRYTKQHRFDYIIDFRMHYKPWQEFLISKFIYTVPTVYSVRHYIIEWYITNNRWLAKRIYGNAYGIVCITDKMVQAIQERHGFTNLIKILSPANTSYISAKLAEPYTPLPYGYIVGAGRMGEDNIKQFDKLITAYANSVLPAKGIRLVLMGQGVLEESHKALAASLGLQDMVVFMGFQENPYVYMRDARFFVLSSKNEGLPQVLIEALTCGTPLVSFDCLSGPAEIVEHEQNGLLVPDQDVPALTQAMDRMCTDEALYAHCKAQALPGIQKFNMAAIGQQWMDFLNIKA